MSTVIVTATVKDLVVKADVVVQGYKVSVTGQPDQIVAVPTATFPDVVPGDYVATVVLVDSAGANIGDPQSASFTIAVPTQTVSVVDVVTVAVS
jgi:hypothetical protein